jgi:hypothetical protein
MLIKLQSIRLRKYINFCYGIFGLITTYISIERLWQEGVFGNETHVLFLIMIGPYIGLSLLFSGLSLTLGQTMELLNWKSGIRFSRISFGFAILALVIHYLLYGETFIWKEILDFIIFSLACLFFYLPVIHRWNYLK